MQQGMYNKIAGKNVLKCTVTNDKSQVQTVHSNNDMLRRVGKTEKPDNWKTETKMKGAFVRRMKIQCLYTYSKITKEDQTPNKVKRIFFSQKYKYFVFG